MAISKFEIGAQDFGSLQSLSADPDGSPVGANLAAARLTNNPQLAASLMAPAQPSAGISLSKPAFNANPGPGGAA